MTLTTIIRSAARRLRTGTAKVSGAAAAVVLLALVTGCQKDRISRPEPTVFGGPADITLILSGKASGTASESKALPSTRALSVDETDIVHTVKIFAFKHDPNYPEQHNQMVGYSDFTGITGPGPHRFSMNLSASGPIDFYVITNDIYAETATRLGPESTRAEIERARFSGFRTDASDAAVPMSNIPVDGKGTGENNFTFEVIPGSTLPQIIPIDVTRAMARLSFYFAKKLENSIVRVTGIGISAKIPVNAPLGLYDNSLSPEYADSRLTSSVSTSPEQVTKTNTNGSMEDENLQMLSSTSYLLPNEYGITNNFGIMPDNADQLTKEHTYAVEIKYEVNGYSYAKTVYLPDVKRNDWIKIKGIIDEKKEVALQVIVNPWTEHTIIVPPFE